MSEFNVAIGKIPGTVSQIMADEPITVAAAASLAGIGGLEGYSVRVNGSPADMQTTLSNDAQVVFIKNAKSNR